jgi:DNA polymerase-3 subunit delta
VSIRVPVAPPAPVYLVHGAEDLLRADALAAIAAAVLVPGLEAFNDDRFEGASCDAAGVVAAARTLPVMAERRLVVVRGADRLAPEKLDALSAYLADANPTTCLVLEAAKVDLRRGPFNKVKAMGQVIACAPLNERGAADWLVARARGLGYPMERAAAEFLAAYTGTSLGALAAELDKAAAFAGEGGRVDLDTVSETAAGGGIASVFELTDALGERRAGVALKALSTLLEGGEPALRVQGMIVRHFRQLWRAREFLGGDAGGAGSLASALGVPPFVADKLRAQARRYRDAELGAAFIRFARVDLDLKGGAASARRTLEDEVLALCG